MDAQLSNEHKTNPIGPDALPIMLARFAEELNTAANADSPVERITAKNSAMSIYKQLQNAYIQVAFGAKK